MGVPQMRQPTKSAASRIASVPHPIITVTQHTPSSTPTPTVSDETGGGGGARPFIREMARKPLNRSYSDSDVSYCAEEQVEAPGSTYYINKQGGIDLIMLLKVGMGRGTMQLAWVVGGGWEVAHVVKRDGAQSYLLLVYMSEQSVAGSAANT